MKKMYLLFVITFLIWTPNLKASCNDSQILADSINYSSFEYMTDEEVASNVVFYNINDSLYFEVTNNYNDDVDVYNSNNFKDGVLTIESKTVTEKINYSLNVYTTDESCPNRILRKINFNTNKYNVYVYHDACKNRYDTIKYCNPFYDVDDMTLDEFVKLVNEETTKLDVHYSFKDYVKKYYLYVLIPFLVISIVYIVRIIIFKRRKKQYV